MRKKFYRQAKKAICIATLSATVLSSIPMIPYTQAYAKGQTTMEELQALSLPTENAVTYNLSDASLRTEKTFVDVYGDELTTKVIEINITKNGNYIIKGSNEINGAFVDTHIKVEKESRQILSSMGLRSKTIRSMIRLQMVVVMYIRSSFSRYWISKERRICM